jgi:hypothetical protein
MVAHELCGHKDQNNKLANSVLVIKVGLTAYIALCIIIEGGWGWNPHAGGQLPAPPVFYKYASRYISQHKRLSMSLKIAERVEVISHNYHKLATA